MINYTGVRCPVCDRPFTEHDDIVVCPECGAPYHRACYEKAGKCVFEEKHGTGEGWKPPKVEAPNPEEEEKTKKCPRCGKMNAQTALFCDQCGQSLIGNTDPPHTYPNQGAGPQGAWRLYLRRLSGRPGGGSAPRSYGRRLRPYGRPRADSGDVGSNGRRQSHGIDR